MEVWAHTMVKNEARWLWYSVNSVINHVDKLLLFDTGSTDGTIEIEKELIKKYPNKIIYKQVFQNTPDEFTVIRQQMLDLTKSDWFLMLDGDEIWWGDSIKKVIEIIKSNENINIESIVVPTINVVGDIFHYQGKSAGMYKFGKLKGHYNLRVIKRNIPGLHSQGYHGVWGWADSENKMIQDRNTFKFVNTPYIHTTFLPRASVVLKEADVIKRQKKLKYEIGKSFPFDYYFPEVLFNSRPDFIASPWFTPPYKFKLRSYFETPVRLIKRQMFPSKIGY